MLRHVSNNLYYCSGLIKSTTTNDVRCEQKPLRDESKDVKQTKNYSVASRGSLCSTNSSLQQAEEIMDDHTITSTSNDPIQSDANDITHTEIDLDDLSPMTLSTDNKISDLRKCFALKSMNKIRFSSD